MIILGIVLTVFILLISIAGGISMYYLISECWEGLFDFFDEDKK